MRHIFSTYAACLALVLCTFMAITPSVAEADGSHDFDWEFGTWKTQVKRRLHPLSGSQEWVEYEGTTSVSKIWNGRSNLVELDVSGPAGHLEALSLRLYNPEARQWSLNFSNVTGGTMATPTVGEFKGGRGEFYSQESFGGRSILVRFVISEFSRESARFEQAFSDDGGKTWETNWIAQDSRSEIVNPASTKPVSTKPVSTNPGYQTTQIAPGLYSFGAGLAFNAFMVTDDGVIVMDSFDKDFAKASLAAIRKVTDKPIRYLVYSHNHYDHISGGEVFKAEGATILCHEAAAIWLKSHPSADVAMPDRTWSGSRSELKLGGSQINLLYFGANHGEGMTVFQFPREKVIYTVDLVVPRRVGFAYMPDFSPKDWERTLAEMSKLDFDRVMFAHNAAVGPRASVAEQLKFLQDLRSAIGAEFKKGTPFMRIPNAVKLPQYETWDGYEEWLPMNTWRVLLEIAMGV